MRAIVLAQALIPWCGGSAISEGSLCANLAKECDVTVLCRAGALDYAFARSFGLTEIQKYQPREVFDAWKDPNHWLNERFREADILHLNGHWKWEHYFLARIATRERMPYLLHPRGMLLLGHRNVMAKRVFNTVIGNWIVDHAAKIIALSRFEVQQFQPYGVEPSRIAVVPNGIPAPEIPPEPSDFHVPSVSTEDPFFLYLGRLESRKNLVFLIDVFSRYLSRGGKAKLLLVGPVERDYDRELQRRIDELKLQGSVHLLPPVYDPEKWFYMRRALAVIYPTLEEPFGRVPFEAISAGTYPIVPDQSGSAEYLSPMLPQCIYKHQDAESLLKTMLEAEKNRTTGTLAGLDKAKAWVKNELDWNRIAKVVTGLYTEILASHKPVTPRANHRITNASRL